MCPPFSSLIRGAVDVGPVGPVVWLAILAALVNVADRCGCDVCKCCAVVLLAVGCGGELVVVGDSSE